MEINPVMNNNDQSVCPNTPSCDSDIEVIDSPREQQGSLMTAEHFEIDTSFGEEEISEEQTMNEREGEEIVDEENDSVEDENADDLLDDQPDQQRDYEEDEQFISEEEEEKDDDDDYGNDGNKIKKAANFKCPYCPSKYFSYGSLYNHKTRIHSKQFNLDKKLRRVVNHKKVIKVTRKYNRRITHGVQRETSYGSQFPCDHCTFSYGKYNSWWQHVRLQHNGRGLVSQTERSEELKRRENSENSDESRSPGISMKDQNVKEENGFSCDHCSMSFRTEMGRLRHVNLVHPEIARERVKNLSEYFACPYCERVYEQYNSVHAHMTNQHPTRIRLPADQLRKSGKSATPTIVKTTQNVKEKNADTPPVEALKCDKCTRTFATIDFLTKHKTTHVKPIVASGSVFCDGCGQVFKGLPYLGRHKRATACGSNSQDNKSLIDQSMDSNGEAASESVLSGSNILNSSETNSNVFTPSVKGFCGGNIKPQRTVLYSRTKDSSSSSVKIEQQSDEFDKISMAAPYVPDPIVATVVKNEPSEIHSPFVGLRPARGSTMAIWKELEDKTKEETSKKAQKRASTAMKNSDSDDCVIIIDDPTIKRQKTAQEAKSPSFLSELTNISGRFSMSSSMNTSFPTDHIEKSRLPLSAAIFTRSAQFPKEFMIIWSSSLEEDLLAAVSLNPANSVLCVKELQILKLNEQHKETLEKCNMVTFNILTSNDTTSQWTVISFEQQLNVLRNRLFKNFMDVEKAFSEHAATQGMMLNNVMRYSKYGLFPILSQSLVQKIMAFNSRE